jgi:putative transposase
MHRVRNSLNFVSWKARKEVAANLKLIDTSASVDLAAQRLTDFAAKWDAQYQSISLSWRRNWARITPFFDYPSAIRKVIDTTNAIESINMSLRKVIKTRASFPSDEAVIKLFYLALNNISKKWTMPLREWQAALNRFTMQFEDRLLPV